MKIDFKGQIVLVTGATRGMGKQMADDFGKAGAEVIVTGTREDEIRLLNRNSGSHGKGGKKYYCVDFTNKVSTNRFLATLGKYSRIDVCINNAGINRIEFIESAKTKDWDDIISVNLKAPFLVIREISKIMKRNGYGRIINMSSIFGVISREKRSIYSASKFGLRGLTTAASNELARYNILVNTVSPGFVLTDLTRKILSEKEIAEMAVQVPIRRFASTEDISRIVLFLASKLNTYITGQNIIVDGGFTNV